MFVWLRFDYATNFEQQFADFFGDERCRLYLSDLLYFSQRRVCECGVKFGAFIDHAFGDKPLVIEYLIYEDEQ